jgi:hypothetical protein
MSSNSALSLIPVVGGWPMNLVKRCPTCRETLPLASFWHIVLPDGRIKTKTGSCKACTVENNKLRRKVKQEAPKKKKRPSVPKISDRSDFDCLNCPLPVCNEDLARGIICDLAPLAPATA